jgi:hypothetical protein
MNREDQHAKHAAVIAAYNRGEDIGAIQTEHNYTSSMIFHILRKHGVATRKVQHINLDPEAALLVPALTRRYSEAQAIMARADMLDARPNLVLNDVEFKRLMIRPKRVKATQDFLKKLNLTILLLPYPALFDLRNNRYWRMTHRELVLLYVDTAGFLQANAAHIRKNWRAKP